MSVAGGVDFKFRARTSPEHRRRDLRELDHDVVTRAQRTTPSVGHLDALLDRHRPQRALADLPPRVRDDQRRNGICPQASLRSRESSAARRRMISHWMTLRSCDEPVGRQDCETRRWQAMPTHDQRWKLPLLFQRFSIRGLCTAPFHFFPLLPWKKVNRENTGQKALGRTSAIASTRCSTRSWPSRGRNTARG